jgi:catechol 2,3-dioxygenase-like lactoylglutathione lyase family enzyme
MAEIAPKNQRLASVTLLVPDHDDAIAYFVGVLGFALVGDSPRAGGDRWVVVAPRGGGTGIRLAKAAGAAQEAAIGRQAAGRVLLVLHTDDLARDYAAYRQNGVVFLEAPRQEPYGAVAVFADLYGNRWDLIEPAPTSP